MESRGDGAVESRGGRRAARARGRGWRRDGEGDAPRARSALFCVSGRLLSAPPARRLSSTWRRWGACCDADAGGWLSGGRGDAGDQPGVSRRESRWSATSREGGAPSRERRRNSPCGSRAARGNLPVRASIERASCRVPFHMLQGCRDRAFVFGFFQTKKVGRVEILSFYLRVFETENIVAKIICGHSHKCSTLVANFRVLLIVARSFGDSETGGKARERRGPITFQALPMYSNNSFFTFGTKFQ